MLATARLLWARTQKKLVAARTAALSIAILGMVMALAGMILAWPNPASIVPAALFNFAVFTAIAVFLNEPRAQHHRGRLADVCLPDRFSCGRRSRSVAEPERHVPGASHAKREHGAGPYDSLRAFRIGL
jgi:hypothetical protein